MLSLSHARTHARTHAHTHTQIQSAGIQLDLTSFLTFNKRHRASKEVSSLWHGTIDPGNQSGWSQGFKLDFKPDRTCLQDF